MSSGVSERCELTSKQMSEWPSAYVWILDCSRPQWFGEDNITPSTYHTPMAHHRRSPQKWHLSGSQLNWMCISRYNSAFSIQWLSGYSGVFDHWVGGRPIWDGRILGPTSKPNSEIPCHVSLDSLLDLFENLPVADIVADFAREDFDFVSDHEGGVEADAELTDQTRGVHRFGAFFFQELFRTRTRDRT